MSNNMKIKDTVHFQWYKSFFVVVLIIVLFTASSSLTEASFVEAITNLEVKKQVDGEHLKVILLIKKMKNYIY